MAPICPLPRDASGFPSGPVFTCLSLGRVHVGLPTPLRGLWPCAFWCSHESREWAVSDSWLRSDILYPDSKIVGTQREAPHRPPASEGECLAVKAMTAASPILGGEVEGRGKCWAPGYSFECGCWRGPEPPKCGPSKQVRWNELNQGCTEPRDLEVSKPRFVVFRGHPQGTAVRRAARSHARP